MSDVEDSSSDSSSQSSDSFQENHATLFELQEAIRSQDAAFYCGGSIPLAKVTSTPDALPDASPDVENATSICKPVTVRYDCAKGGSGKITFKPTSAEDLPSVENEMIQLLKSCSNASFGMNGTEVFDEGYRRAVKLDVDQFSTNFNPYECVIIDAISQTLLPTIVRPYEYVHKDMEEHVGIIAELYKLNIYSAPSGKFRAHVDTPRSDKQFGSLVVCLPYTHSGGQLRVAHRGTEHAWDWSRNYANSIGWAAFFSDCEHEVLEVVSGHRVTLTYNLSRYDHLQLFKHLELTLSIRPVLDQQMENDYEKDYDSDTGEGTMRGLYVGTGLHGVQFSDEGGDDSGNTIQEIVLDNWTSQVRNDIHWLNRRGPQDLALVHLTYGNEPGVTWRYSSVAFLIQIPPYAERQARYEVKEQLPHQQHEPRVTRSQTKANVNGSKKPRRGEKRSRED